MENTELLRLLNRELINFKETNEKILKENKALKNNNDVLNCILAQIPTKKLCYELANRNNENIIELEESDKIFIFTSKGTQELKDKNIILAIKI